MSKLNNNFLAVDKNLFKLGLNANEILILAQILEFQRNTGDCFISNEVLASQFGMSVSTVKRTIDKLEENGYIKRTTKNKQKGKERHLTVNEDFTRFKMNLPEGSNCPLRKEQNEPVKDNIKRKDIKDNFAGESNTLDTCGEEQQATPSTQGERNQQQVANSYPKPIAEEKESKVDGKIKLADIQGIEGINYTFIAVNRIKTATGKILEVIK